MVSFTRQLFLLAVTVLTLAIARPALAQEPKRPAAEQAEEMQQKLDLMLRQAAETQQKLDQLLLQAAEIKQQIDSIKGSATPAPAEPAPAEPAAAERVRTAGARLDGLDGLPVAAHIVTYDDLHVALQDALADLDEA